MSIPRLLALLLLLPQSRAQEPPWSWRPLERPALPAGATHPVDALVRLELERHGLEPSPPADRRTLLRRLCIDLTGLPPTPERLERFLADERPDAWERAVDELLNDPGFGEAWGRHWLDVARYADTHGFDKDKVRPHAWPYRDWVVRALDASMPFDRFARWQIAGDVLAAEEPDATLATGFLAAGPWDFVGHVELREGTRDKQITRNLDRDEMLTGVTSAFLATTVHCARCHDHEFDPIPQRDYYALQAVFAGVERANRSVEPDRETGERRSSLERRLTALAAEIARLERAPPDGATEDERSWFARRDDLERGLAHLEPPDRASATNGFHGEVASAPKTEQWVEVDLGRARPIDTIRLWPARPVDFPDTPGFGFPPDYRLDIEHEDAEGRSLTTLHPGVLPTGDEPIAILLDGRPVSRVRVVATTLWERRKDFVFALAELELLEGDVNHASHATVVASSSIEAGLWSKAHLVDGWTSRHRLEGSPWMRARARLATLRARCDAVWEAREGSRAARELALLRIRHEEFVRERSALPARRSCYAVARSFPPRGQFTPPPEEPRPIHVLARGAIDHPLDRVFPGALTRLAPTSLPPFPADARSVEGAARRALAEWITHEANPLFWRVSANRVWQHLIGRPLVDTPNDFGRMGAPPSHPALLDFLACELRDGKLSWKELVRLVATSATYRQASQGHPRGLALDASNRLVWRMNRKRLNAESVRDTLLLQAGELDRSRGGPGFRAFVFEDDHSPRYLYDQGDPNDPTTARRSIYRLIVRSVREPFHEALDDADPCTSVGRRDETLTPLQALTLLNHPFVLARAHALARHLERSGVAPLETLDRLYRDILLRAPSDPERHAVTPYLRDHGVAATARLLWNTNEFLYVD